MGEVDFSASLGEEGAAGEEVGGEAGFPVGEKEERARILEGRREVREGGRKERRRKKGQDAFRSRRRGGEI